MVMMATVSRAQVPVVTKTECYCLNNSTTSTNGQYLDTIIIAATPGQVWRLLTTNNSKFYHPASLPPPAAPIPYLNNTNIPETNLGISGIYRIAGKRVSGQPWSVQVKNMNTNQVIDVTNSQSCSYPNFVITGDEDVCRNSVSPESYSIPGPGSTYNNLTWFISGGFSGVLPLLPATGQTSINVMWGPTAGRYSMGVSGVNLSYGGQALGCSFNLTRPIDVEDIKAFTTIRGDAGNCIGSSEIYRIDAPISQLSDPIIWKIDNISGASFASTVMQSGINRNQRTITWPSTAGEYNLIVSGNFILLNGPGNLDDNSCPFADTMRIKIVNEATPSLACQNLVNLSMNPSCELYFAASQFLEAQLFSDTSYDIIIKDLSTNTIIPTGTLGYGYIGKTLEIRVIHECSGNSCWGYAKVEDKSIPVIQCPADATINCIDINNLALTGFPVMPLDIIRTPVLNQINTWTVTGFDRCSDVTMSFIDVATPSCTGPYSSVITRTWRITDNSGNSSSCIQTISVRAASLADVIFPTNWDDVTGPNPSLVACGPWPKVPYVQNGVIQSDSVPSPDYTGRPIGILCLKAHITYSDRKILICNNNAATYKLYRKWTVLDHCTGKDTSLTQLIAVMDNQPPAVTCPADITDQPGRGPITPAARIMTKPYQCNADWNVLPPIVINDCSSTSWIIEFLIADSQGLPPVNGVYTSRSGAIEVTGVYPNYVLKNIPTGRTWVRYTITDACGNFSYCFTEIDVIDNQPPVPVCDRNSVVAVSTGTGNGQGIGIAGVLTFDDGSHDNCGITCMKVRRMDNPVTWESLPCDNKLTFTCADVNKTIMVELGVWDAGGAFNSCMVEAKVQDNIFPVLTIPANATANCYENFTDLTRFGRATVTDNCVATIDTVRLDSLNECGLGTISRRFTATDTYGNKTTKVQVITVGNNRKLTDNDISWPGTLNLNAACMNDVSPDKLNSKPFAFRNIECAKIAMTHEDLVFNFADNVCVKILRKWTVIDWCQKDPNVPGSGEWSRTQLIMLNNTDAPTITKGCLPSDLTVTQVGVCQANVRVTAVATDLCTAPENLIWSYTIDENNDGSLEVSNGTSKTIDRNFPYGTHKITWSVLDGCRNISNCTNIFTLRDDKKPTPICITELVTVIMPSNGEVAIWASEFIKDATDNCSTKSQITAAFSVNKRDISRIIRCTDLAGLSSKEFSYDVYVIDSVGNSDYCTVRLRVQSNSTPCKSPISMKGSVYSENNEMVQNVGVQLKSEQIEFPKSAMTGSDGKWNITGLKADMDYSIYPGKNDNPLNGVSTLDLVMIQRHILGVSELDSPFKLIAADVNNSQKVTAADIVELRKLILGIQTEFKNNTSWRFVDVAHQFADMKNPFPYIENISMNKAGHDVTGLDFIAVKVGDVNSSARKNANSGIETGIRNVIKLETEYIHAKKGDIVSVSINSEDLQQMTGVQMTLGIDNSVTELISVQSDAMNLTNENLGLRNLSEGLIHLSWNDHQPVQIKNELMTLTFRMMKEVKDKSLVKLENAYLNPEVYTKEGNDVNVSVLTLQPSTKNAAQSDQFELFQNVPNPFNASTIIGFNLPQADEVTMKIFDVTGKLIYQTKAEFSKGYNTFNIDANALNLNGVLYYQIETDTDSATRKMIVIK